MITYIINFLIIILAAINYFTITIVFYLLKNLYCTKYIFNLIVNLLTNFSIFFLQYLSIFSKIKLQKLNIDSEKILVNCNHTGAIDDILTLVVLKKIIKNFDFKLTRSVSNLSSEIEEGVFNFIDSIVINDKILFQEIDKKLNHLVNSYENLYLIFFLEGAKDQSYNRLMQNKFKIKLKNLNFPKTLLFNTVCEKNYFDYLLDINVIYSYQGKIVSGELDFKYYLDKNMKANVKINIYKMPKENYEEWLFNLYRKKDICLENIKKDINNTIR